MIDKSDNIHLGLEKLGGAKRLLRLTQAKKKFIARGGRYWDDPKYKGIVGARQAAEKKYMRRASGGNPEALKESVPGDHVKMQELLDNAVRYSTRVGDNQASSLGTGNFAELARKAVAARPIKP